MSGFDEKKSAVFRLNDTLCRNIPLSLHFFRNRFLIESSPDQSCSVITKKYTVILTLKNFFRVRK